VKDITRPQEEGHIVEKDIELALKKGHIVFARRNENDPIDEDGDEKPDIDLSAYQRRFYFPIVSMGRIKSKIGITETHFRIDSNFKQPAPAEEGEPEEEKGLKMQFTQKQLLYFFDKFLVVPTSLSSHLSSKIDRVPVSPGFMVSFFEFQVIYETVLTVYLRQEINGSTVPMQLMIAKNTALGFSYAGGFGQTLKP